MTKKAILKKRVLREYRKPTNWEYSEFKGYPKCTYYGYKSFNELWREMIREFQFEYGKGLRKWRYI